MAQELAKRTGRDLFVVVVAGFVFRLGLLLLFPVPYGEDGFGRIYFKDRIFLGHWLPLAQGLVYASARLWEGIIPVRLVFCACGALAAGGFYLFLRRVASRRAALLGATLFSLNKLYVVLSLMPYQDVLFLGLYYGGLSLLFPGEEGSRFLRSKGGSVLSGLANLTRYEGWFVLPVLALWKLKRELDWSGWAKTARAVMGTAVFFGWAPLAWFLMSWFHWHGWSEFLFQPADRRFYGWHPHLDLGWALGYGWRWLSWIVRFGTPLTFLAVWGFLRFRRSGRPLPPGLRLLLINVALTSIFFFFIIGKEQETVFRFVMFAFSAVLVFTAVGMDDLLARFARRWLRTAVWIGVACGLMVHSAVAVQRLNESPEHKDPYEVARFLEKNLGISERAVVVAERAPNLQDDAPILYQRIVAQTSIERNRVLAAGNLAWSGRERLLEFSREARIRYLVVFLDFEPRLPADVFYAGLSASDPDWLEPVMEGEMVRVHRVKEWPRQ